MADTNEEQLLTKLLGRIAREDARLDAMHLETRVMEAASAGATGKADRTYSYRAMAATIVAAVLVPAMFWMMPQAIDTKVRLKADTTEEVVAEPEKFAVAQPSIAQPTRPAFAPLALQRGKPTRPTRPTRPTLADEFVPLMPMTEQDLAGPFQLVRVQMPNASLGPLRSLRQHPGDLIEADVLLGEDGMARAIRVSASGSVYPWRSR